MLERSWRQEELTDASLTLGLRSSILHFVAFFLENCVAIHVDENCGFKIGENVNVTNENLIKL